MKIYLHIGTEKTGTTSIQGFLADNRDELRKHKIMYSKVLGDPNNIRLSIALQNIDKIDDSRIHSKITTKEAISAFRNDLKESLKNEIASENPDILIVSSEHLSSRMNKPEEIERLKLFLNEFSEDITIIVYLRRQDKFFESLYSTAIKKGHVLDFDFPIIGQEREDFHYNRMLKLWENVFGLENISVNIFEKIKLFEQDAISDFIHTLHLPVTYVKKKEKRENLSFGRKKLAFLKEFNSFVPEIINERINPSRANIERLLETIEIKDNPVEMPSDAKSEFLERFTAENREVSKRYFDEDNLFDMISLSNNEKVDISISSQESIEISSKIWIKKQIECIDKSFTIETLKIELALEKGNHEHALNTAEIFWRRHPNHPKTNCLYAKTLYVNNKIEDAKKYCEKAIELNPENKEFYLLLNLINQKSLDAK